MSSNATKSLEINKTLTSAILIGETDCDNRYPALDVSGGVRIRKTLCVNADVTIKKDLDIGGNVTAPVLNADNVITDDLTVLADSVMCGSVLVKGNVTTNDVGLSGNCIIADDDVTMACATNSLVEINSPITDIDGNLNVDTVNEFSGASGVTIDGLLIKDGAVGPAGVKIDTLRNIPISSVAPLASQVLTFNGSEWTGAAFPPATLAGDVENTLPATIVTSFLDGIGLNGSPGSSTIGIGVGTTLGGSRSVGIGTNALSNNTGVNNTAIGHKSLENNVGGNNNTAVGVYALQQNTASNNTSVGNYSLMYNTTGANNTAVGFSSGKSNVDGARNTAAGNYSFMYNTSGNDNVALGYNALKGSAGNDTFRNVAAGYSAMRGTSGAFTGNDNVAAGLFSGLVMQGNSSCNTLIGSRSGQTITTGNDNVCLGYLSGSGLTTGNKNIIIGANSTAVGDSSGCIILGRSASVTGNNILSIGSAVAPLNTFVAPTTTLPAGIGFIEVRVNGLGPYKLPFY